MPKRQDNISFVRDLMNHSQFGPLAQLFVLDALSKWADKVAEADPAAIESPMISGAAWVGVAKEIKGKIDARIA
ncbi:hypothetical protein QA639_21310 [Bradyrhizobium pachyrhizi]|uniref:hypothetical protein n=1 Tax=Bradyrhizobium pachyrhizi TaxID=280333 RepID=UPI0024B20FED|nr:hypothetical protein [Bradyrhizobium pachyrhizi]WFU52249.1 hypothetical protein QA639_21310 [Bradyrhizobium pachyrhizi]